MPEKTTAKDRLKEITESIETGIQELFQSDKYAEYLRTMRAYLDADEAELRTLTDSAIKKLGAITDKEYAALELIPDFEE